MRAPGKPYITLHPYTRPDYAPWSAFWQGRAMPNDPFYTSTAWRECRAAFLRSHRTCSVDGCAKRAGHVDHVTPRRRGGAAFDPANLRALCHGHHSSKTAAADGGFGNTPGVWRPVVRGCDASGRPLDPSHPWNAAPAALRGASPPSGRGSGAYARRRPGCLAGSGIGMSRGGGSRNSGPKGRREPCQRELRIFTKSPLNSGLGNQSEIRIMDTFVRRGRV